MRKLQADILKLDGEALGRSLAQQSMHCINLFCQVNLAQSDNFSASYREIFGVGKIAGAITPATTAAAAAPAAGAAAAAPAAAAAAPAAAVATATAK